MKTLYRKVLREARLSSDGETPSLLEVREPEDAVSDFYLTVLSHEGTRYVVWAGHGRDKAVEYAVALGAELSDDVDAIAGVAVQAATVRW